MVMTRFTRLGPALLCCGHLSACAHAAEGGGGIAEGDDGECVSHYSSLARAATWHGLRDAMLASQEWGRVASRRTQARGDQIDAEYLMTTIALALEPELIEHEVDAAMQYLVTERWLQVNRGRRRELVDSTRRPVVGCPGRLAESCPTGRRCARRAGSMSRGAQSGRKFRGSRSQNEGGSRRNSADLRPRCRHGRERDGAHAKHERMGRRCSGGSPLGVPALDTYRTLPRLSCVIGDADVDIV